MREQFEKLPSISCILDRGVYFDQENNMYKGGSDEDYFWINGAWYSFQEQQKKIDAVRSWAKYHIEDFNLQESNSDHDRGWYNASCQVFININNMCGD